MVSAGEFTSLSEDTLDDSLSLQQIPHIDIIESLCKDSFCAILQITLEAKSVTLCNSIDLFRCSVQNGITVCLSIEM